MSNATAATQPTLMKRFQVFRTADVSGVSGTGLIAEGCEMSNGRVLMQWLTPYQSVSFFDNIKSLETIHGHGGNTQVKWVDP